jgi:hypothetical protein
MNLNFSQEESNFIKNNYGKISYKQMAQDINREWMDIRHHAKSIGIITKHGQNHKQRFSGKQAFSVNQDFFQTYTPLSCYWAGFLAADGTLTENSNKNKIITLKLSKKDLIHIIQFKKDTNFAGPILIYKTKYILKNNQNQESCQVKISNCKIFDDLVSNFNVTPQKTFSLKFPTQITNPDLIKCFIIGYIDGDGYIGTKKSKYLRLTILGNEVFLKSLSTFLYNELNILTKVKPKPNTRIHYIEINGSKAKTILKDLLRFKNITSVLSRKWNIEQYI